MYENPSAGKFDPPPTPEASTPARSRSRWVVVPLVIASAYLLTHWVSSFPGGRRWLPFVTGGAAFASGVLHIVLNLRRRDEIEGQDPHSPPTSITR